MYEFPRIMEILKKKLKSNVMEDYEKRIKGGFNLNSELHFDTT